MVFGIALFRRSVQHELREPQRVKNGHLEGATSDRGVLDGFGVKVRGIKVISQEVGGEVGVCRGIKDVEEIAGEGGGEVGEGRLLRLSRG